MRARRNLSAKPARRWLATVGLVLWGVGGGFFLAGLRIGADLAIGAALALFAATVAPLPAFRGGSPTGTRSPR